MFGSVICHTVTEILIKTLDYDDDDNDDVHDGDGVGNQHK